MPIHVQPSRRAEAIRRHVQAALDFVGRPDEPIRVSYWGVPLRPDPNGGECMANVDGIQIHRFTMARENDFRLGFLLFEEVGHVLLHRAGVPAGQPVADFYQELFATWVQVAGYLRPKGMEPDIVSPVDPDPDWMPYTAGKHVGASLAGSEASRRELEAWLAIPRMDGWVVMASALYRGLTPPLTPEGIADLYRHTVKDAA